MVKELWAVLGVGAALAGSVAVTVLATRDIPVVEETRPVDAPASRRAAPGAGSAETRPIRPPLEAVRPAAPRVTPSRVVLPHPRPPVNHRGR